MSRFHSRHRGRAEAERREAFARTVGCELRDPLMIADATLKQAQSDLDPEHFATIKEAHARMSRRLDDLSAFARRGSTVRDTRSVDLGTVARRRWGQLRTADATLTVKSTYRLRAEPQLFGLLLDQLFRSLLEYALAPSRPTVTGPTVAKTARSDMGRAPEAQAIVVAPSETVDGHGFYVGVDRDGSQPVTDGKHVFDDNAVGFEIIAALRVARDIVSSCGWSTELIRDESGVRFEIATSDTSVD